MGSVFSRYSDAFQGKQHIQSLTHGIYLRSEHFGSWVRSMVFLLLPLLAALVQIGCVVADVAEWHSRRLCAKETVCDSSADVTEQCAEFDSYLKRLFLLYSMATPVAVTKVTTVGVLLASHRSLNMPTAASFDIRTLERTVAGVAFWITFATLDCAVAVMAVYRYVVFASQEGEFAEQLYPDEGVASSATLLIMGLGSCLLSVGISVTVAVMRCMWLNDKLGEMKSPRSSTVSDLKELTTSGVARAVVQIPRSVGEEEQQLLPSIPEDLELRPFGIFEVDEAPTHNPNPTHFETQLLSRETLL